MFFVLSGFLIVSLLLRERRELGAISLRKFYARRALRILPPFYGLLALLTLGHAITRGSYAAAFFKHRGKFIIDLLKIDKPVVF